MEAEVQRVKTKIGALGALSHNDKGYAKALLNEDPTRVKLFEGIVEDEEILGAVNLMFQRAKGAGGAGPGPSSLAAAAGAGSAGEAGGIAPGAGGGAGPGPVAEPLTAEQRLHKLLTLCKDQYDHARGQRLQAELQQRMRSTPITEQQDILQIADYFRPLGFHNLVPQLMAALIKMEMSHQAYIDGGSLDTYQRLGHIVQLAAAPGLGKSTASRLLWVALHLELKQRFPVPLSSEAVLQQRILNSITPNNLLIFQLDLGKVGLRELDPQEESMLHGGSSNPWACILAWRLLYSVLHVSCQLPSALHLPYGQFLQQLSIKSRRLLLSLEPLDVVSFVRACAAVGDRPVLMAWALDEAQSFKYIPQLLSAFVQFRTTCIQRCTGCAQHTPSLPAATLPVCLVMSTLWSSTSLAQTDSQKARIYDIQLGPLNRLQMCAVLTHVQQRLQLHAASKHGGAGSSMQAPPAERDAMDFTPSSELHQLANQHGGASSSEQAPSREWEPMDFTRSSELHHFAKWHDDALLLLDIVGGNPRLLAFLVSAVVDVLGCSPGGALMHWIHAGYPEMTTLKAAAVNRLRSELLSARFGWHQEGGAAQPIADEAKQPLVKAMVTHAVTGIMVQRSAYVAAAASGALGKVTWEVCEQRGYVTLLTPGVQATRLSEGGVPRLPEPGELVYVVMPPIMLSVLGVGLFPQLQQVSALVGSVVSHRAREQVDCAMIALRAWLARNNIPGMTEMSVEQLVCGRSSSQAPAQLEQPSTSQPAMEGMEGPAMPVLQQRILLPTKPPVLRHMHKKLDDSQFAALISEFERNHQMPYAWFGPGNHKADSWVLMRMPCTNPTAAPSSSSHHSKALIIYISSKQRAGQQADIVYAHNTQEEAKKDVWGITAPYVYVYVTDQHLAVGAHNSEDERILVVGPQQHEAFCGSAWALVQLMRER